MAPSRRGSVRTGTKRVVETIRENVEHLRDHPEDAVPQCKGRCPLWCPFRRARKGVRRRHGMIGDDEKLERWARWGNKYARAYATALRVAEADDDALEYLQDVGTHQGRVPIAPWGDAPGLAHVGMQHHHDPSLRLLGAIEFVRSGDVVFATEDGTVCAHDGAPPDEALDMLFERLPVDRPDAGPATCPHVPGEGPADDRALVQLAWPTADLTVRVCEACLQGSVLGSVRSVMVTESIRNLVDVSVLLEPLTDVDGDPVRQVEWSLPDTVLDAYANLEMRDEDLIDEARTARRFAVEALGEAWVVVDGTVHRPPFDELVPGLDAEGTEAELVEAALAGIDRPVVLAEANAIDLLEAVWPAQGDRALEEVLGEDARDLFEPDADAGDLERLIEVVDERLDAQRVEAKLPSYGDLPPAAELADEVGRAYIRGGRDAAKRVLTSTPDPGAEAVALALVQALDLPRSSWTVSPRTEDMAEHLVPKAEAFIRAEGEAYHEALEELVRATGSTADLERLDEAH
jgi:hypothetical protein